jgi:UDP-N-acetyl-D-glucosamine dehydrogenase
LLTKRGAEVTFSDPYVSRVQVEQHTFEADNNPEAISQADCVVIITDHKAIDYKDLVEKAQLVVDTRNALKGIQSPKIVRL